MTYQVASCVASIVYNTDWKIVAPQNTLRFGLFLKYELYVCFLIRSLKLLEGSVCITNSQAMTFAVC